ncbi:TATA element modulatory factor [Nymphon striatum]|nr:TATA element modulatory factor [Nymphon striatum]
MMILRKVLMRQQLYRNRTNLIKMNILPFHSAKTDDRILAHRISSSYSEKFSEIAGSPEEGEIQTSSDTLVLSEEESSETFGGVLQSNNFYGKESSGSQNLSLLDENDDQQCSDKDPLHTKYILKIDVEMMSGHTSGDEIETTTSSDIEIISSPNGSSNVSGRDSRASTSPGKQTSNAVSVCKDSQDKVCYEGSILQSSGMVSGNVACKFSNRMNKTSFPNYSSSSSKLKLHQGGMKKRRNSDTSSEEMESVQPSKAFIKKIADMTAVIDARESKLLELSKENVLIKENNMELQEKYQQLKEKHLSCPLEISKISSNLQEKVKTTEQKLTDAIQDRNDYERKYRSAKEEVARRLRHEEVQNVIQEKEQQIQELLSEGEILSKQQLQHSNIIKKLRAKEKETDETLRKTKESLNEQMKELESTKKLLELKAESEKQNSGTIKPLRIENERLEKEINQCKSDLEDANEKIRGMKSTLDNSYKEVIELHKLIVVKDNQIEEADLSAEMSFKEKLKDAVGHIEKNSAKEKESLISQIEELQLSNSKAEKKAKYREEMLQQDINNLQDHLQMSECHNDEVSQNISAATRPLLRQIENLQSTFNAQSKTSEAVEKNLTERLMEAQRQLAVATEKEKIATEKYMEISSRCSVLESQNASLLREKTVLNSSLDVEKSRVSVLEDSKTKAVAQIESAKKCFAGDIAALKKSKHESEMEATVMREKYETEQKTVQYLQEQLDREKNASIILSESGNYSSGANTPMSMSRISSDDNMSQSMFSLNFNQGNRMSVYETLRSGGNTSSLIENLQSQLKQREGEILHLQNDMSNMEKIRESMSQEIVSLSTSNDKLQSELQSLQELKEKFRVMEGQYNALLQMYGEKIEETEELKLDLQDVKDMYRIQIDQLLQQKT